MTEEVNPKAYPSKFVETPLLAKRSVSRASSDESLSKVRLYTKQDSIFN